MGPVEQDAPWAGSKEALSRNRRKCFNDGHVATYRSLQSQVLRIPAARRHLQVSHQPVLLGDLEDEMRSIEADADIGKKFNRPCPRRPRSGAYLTEWNVSPRYVAGASSRSTIRPSTLLAPFILCRMPIWCASKHWLGYGPEGCREASAGPMSCMRRLPAPSKGLANGRLTCRSSLSFRASCVASATTSGAGPGVNWRCLSAARMWPISAPPATRGNRPVL